MALRTYCWHLPHFDIWGHCSHPWGCYETNSFQKCPNKSVCRKHLCLPILVKFTNHCLLWNSWGILILKLSFGMTSRDRSWTCWNPAWTVYVTARTVSKKNKYTVLVVYYIMLYLSFRNTHSQPLVTTLKHHLCLTNPDEYPIYIHVNLTSNRPSKRENMGKPSPERRGTVWIINVEAFVRHLKGR